jgi:hypothetical protein
MGAINGLVDRLNNKWIDNVNTKTEYYLSMFDDTAKPVKHYCYICEQEIKYPATDNDTFSVDFQYGRYWWTCDRKFCQTINKDTIEPNSIENEVKDMFDDLD